MIKTILVSVVTTVVVAGLMFALVGSNTPAVGGDTRFPNSQLSAQGLTLTGIGTTTLDVGKVCLTVEQVDGDTSYAFFSATGNLATSSTSCE